MQQKQTPIENVLAGVLSCVQAQYADMMRELSGIKIAVKKVLAFQKFQRKFYEKSPAYPVLVREGLI